MSKVCFWLRFGEFVYSFRFKFSTSVGVEVIIVEISSSTTYFLIGKLDLWSLSDVWTVWTIAVWVNSNLFGSEVSELFVAMIDLTIASYLFELLKLSCLHFLEFVSLARSKSSGCRKLTQQCWLTQSKQLQNIFNYHIFKFKSHLTEKLLRWSWTCNSSCIDYLIKQIRLS